MATLTIARPRLVKTDIGNYEVLENAYRVEDNQTWQAGDFLRLNTSGLLERCANDVDSATGGIQFYALEDQADPDNSTTFATVLKITEDMEFEGNVYHSTAASALAASSIIGQKYGLVHVTSAGAADADGIPVVDLEDTSNPAFQVTAIASDYDESGENTAADVYGLCRFKVLAACIDADPAA